MSGSFNVTKSDALDALINGRSAGVYKIALLMTNSNVGNAGAEDALVLSGLTLDEMNGANYVRKDCPVITVTKDDSNDRGNITFGGDLTWTALGPGTRDMKCAVILEDTNDDDDNSTCIPRWWLTGGFPVAGDDNDFILELSAVEIRLP